MNTLKFESLRFALAMNSKKRTNTECPTCICQISVIISLHRFPAMLLELSP